MRIRQFVVEGLGHLSTLVSDDAAGVACVVDPRRDVDVYLDEIGGTGVRITHVLETHLHNDYVSGARELAALTGAQHVIGAGAGLAYEHRGARDGETVDVGSLRFTVLDTPGHTPEHVAYSVADRSRADDPAILFTGGSLLVGAVGRTDLLGEERALPFAHDQFRTIHDVVLRHEDFVGVFPTHGAGSLCSTGIASTPFSTIGYERRHNPMVRATDIDAFARALLAGQPAFPAYFARMRPTNQAGPALLGGRIPDARRLDVADVRAALVAGAQLVDLRPAQAHAMGHVPGSLSIPAGPSFGTWLGWVVEPDRPIVLLLDEPADWDAAIRQAMRIGYEAAVVGHVAGGFGAWTDSGADVEVSGQLTVEQLAARLHGVGREAPLVIDVRQASEFERGHVPGSVHIGAGDLPERLAELPKDRPIAAICASGYRSSVAASLLRRAGFQDVAWVASGLPAWQAGGLPVATGGEAGDIVDPSGGTDAAMAAAHGGHRH